MTDKIEPLCYERIEKELDDKLFKVIETEDCLQKSAIRMANFIFNNSNQIATNKMNLPICVGWEFQIRNEKYQVVMEIRKEVEE